MGLERRTNPGYLSDGEASFERDLLTNMVRGIARNQQIQQQLIILKEKMEAAMKKLRQKDIALIDVDANERSISHRLALYIEGQFEGWDVDCEYNRYGYGDKKAILNEDLLNHWRRFPVSLSDQDAKSIFPDIIVHHRCTNKNLLVVEVKKSTTDWNSELDVQKLVALTLKKYKFAYEFGLRLVISMNDTNDKYEWYQDGNKFSLP